MFDCTNQYGFSMSQPLPEGNFVFEHLERWEDENKNPDLEKIFKLEVDGERGYIFEVDLGKISFEYLFDNVSFLFIRVSIRAPQ